MTPSPRPSLAARIEERGLLPSAGCNAAEVDSFVGGTGSSNLPTGAFLPLASGPSRRLWDALNAIGLNPLGKVPGMIEESC